MDNLYEKINYSANVPFIFSKSIYEYDIEKANISILYSKGIISKEYYDKLYHAYKLQRQIAIGNLQKQNSEITHILQKGIIEAKKELFELNDIDPGKVLSIKNDAVFLIGKILNITSVLNDNVKFILKNSYNSFVRLSGIEVYYMYNRTTGNEAYSIKGLGKSEYLHEEYMIDFILFILSSIQTESIESTIGYIKDFYNQYINRNLPIGYYREFNSSSKYIIGEYAVNDIIDTIDNKNKLNISYNANILKILMQYISTIYLMH